MPFTSNNLKTTLLGGLLLTAAAFPVLSQDHTDDSMITQWLNTQTNVQTWSADFVQIRNLKALTQPLTASGHIWFSAPNQFRWEIQKPSPTIAMRQPDRLWVMYPRLKRAEEYSLDSTNAGPWKDTLSLLDAGFPRSRGEIESRFNIIAQTTTNDIHTVTLQPKSETARRFMPEIKIAFETNHFVLHSTSLKFADGSTMENVFSSVALNPKIAASEFIPETNGYKIIEPFKK